MLILVRGLPGSGKSTLAKQLQEAAGFKWYEADQFFDRLGYFTPTRLCDAHAECLHQTRLSLDAGRNVVVSNTFSQYWEIKQYIDYARKIGVPYTIINMTGEWKSVHGVSDLSMQAMRMRWEDSKEW